MRLTGEEISGIKEVIYEMDTQAKIRLFGSRVNDALRGGDIDLLILSNTLGLKEKLIIRFRLKEKLGNRKIDLIITSKPKNAFTRHALKESVLL